MKINIYVHLIINKWRKDGNSKKGNKIKPNANLWRNNKEI